MQKKKEEFHEALKKYDWTKDLQVGHFIDAKDTVNNWCVAIIEKLDHETSEVSVHFEGWSKKYDEVRLPPSR